MTRRQVRSLLDVPLKMTRAHAPIILDILAEALDNRRLSGFLTVESFAVRGRISCIFASLLPSVRWQGVISFLCFDNRLPCHRVQHPFLVFSSESPQL